MVRLIPENVVSADRDVSRFLIAGYLIRLALMPTWISMDMHAIIWVSFILKEYQQAVPIADTIPIFYILAGLYSLLSPVLGDNYFSDILSNTRYSPFVSSIPFRISAPGITTLTFISKIPNLVFDITLGLVLLRILDQPSKAVFAFKLWMLNPISIIISCVIGQYDIIAVFFFMLSLYFLKRGTPTFSLLCLGISAVFKPYTLGFIPFFFLSFVRGEELRSKLINFSKQAAIILLPLALTWLVSFFTPAYYEPANIAYPHWEFYNGFFGEELCLPQTFKYSNPLLAGLFLIAIDFPAEVQLFDVQSIYLLPLVYFFVILSVVHWRLTDFESLWRIILVLLLSYYSVSYFHVQWFLAGQPLLIMFISTNRKTFLKFFLPALPLFIAYSFFWDKLIATPLFPGIDPLSTWSALGFTSFVKSIGLPPYQLLNIIRSAFSSTMIFFAILIVLDLVRLRRERLQ